MMSDSQDCLCNHQEQISHFLQTYQHCLQIVLIMQYLQKIFCTGFAKLFNLLIFWNVSDIQIVVRFNIFNTINKASRSQQFKYLKLFLIVFSSTNTFLAKKHCKSTKPSNHREREYKEGNIRAQIGWINA